MTTNPQSGARRFELMAPAGSWAALRAAIHAGAGAVYFGVEGLNMRNGAGANFTVADLAQIAAECAAAGVSSYLTVNTVIFDGDMERMRQIVDAAARARVTAIIASDIAVMQYARSRGVEVHISTQCNITNLEAVRFWARWADVMVLARELDLEQVRAIHDGIEREGIRGPRGELVRLEMFCHGALCMATSGKCYMSLHELGRSANRGQCGQVCRRSYTLTDRETGEQIDVENQYLMSPKDLKTIHFLNKMVEAGVSVFKIEGRARGPEYVAETVRCYREALQAIADGTYGDDKIAAWERDLGRVFNRGFWDGYYLGQRLGEWSARYGSSATRRRRYAAKGTRYYDRIGVGEFLLEAGTLRRGDEIIIEGPVTGAIIMRADEIHGPEGTEVEQVDKGQLFAIKTGKKIRPSDRLYVWETTA